MDLVERQKYWKLRLDQAKFDGDSVLYVTFEDLAELREMEVEQEREDFRRNVSRFKPPEAWGVIGSFLSTPLVVDPERRDVQVARLGGITTT